MALKWGYLVAVLFMWLSSVINGLPILGMLSLSSGDEKYSDYIIDCVIKEEALAFAVLKEDVKIGYELISTCNDTTPRDKLNFAVNRWLKGATNNTPVAIITDLPNEAQFRYLEFEREKAARKMPLISLNHRASTAGNSYSMSPQGDMSARAIYELVRHLNWNIIDLVHYDDGSHEFAYFKDLTQESEVCILNEVSFSGDGMSWVERGKKQSPSAVLFSKSDNIPEALRSRNLSYWNIILGIEVPRMKSDWLNNISSVVGIRMHHGNVKSFEKHLRTSARFDDTVKVTLCSNISTEECMRRKNEIITEKSYLGASVIDAIRAVAESCRTSVNGSIGTGLTGIRVTSATGRTVSFDANNLTRSEIEYDVLNLQKHNLRNIGAIKLTPRITVTLNREISWLQQSPQGRCSADCKPGTLKKNWDRAGRCCWDCVECVSGTVSFNVNSTKCVSCPVGKKPTSDQSKCQPPYVDYLKWHDPLSLIMIFLLIFTICFLVYALIIFVKKSNTPVFLRSKSASLPFLLSLFITFFLPVILLTKPTPSTCGVYHVFFMFSLGMPLTFLIARSHIVLKYCYDDDGELKRKWLSCSPQTVITLILILLQIIIVVIILSVVPPEVLIFTSPGSDLEYIECASHSRPEFLPLVFFLLLLTMVFNMLHMNEESSPLNQNEVKFVSLCIYNMYALIFVYFVGVFGINGKKKLRVLCTLAYLFGVNFFVNVFLPKIYVILYKPEQNLMELNRILKDENENEATTWSNKRDCVESPRLGLPDGRYDCTEV